MSFSHFHQYSFFLIVLTSYVRHFYPFQRTCTKDSLCADSWHFPPQRSKQNELPAELKTRFQTSFPAACPLFCPGLQTCPTGRATRPKLGGTWDVTDVPPSPPQQPFGGWLWNTPDPVLSTRRRMGFTLDAHQGTGKPEGSCWTLPLRKTLGPLGNRGLVAAPLRPRKHWGQWQRLLQL